MKNCANYGGVTHSGTSNSAHIGGIVGWPVVDSLDMASIQNCLNYGEITHDGTSKYLYVGGILGYASETNLENCVSAGKITSNKASSYIGSIVGYAHSGSAISRCYWTSDTVYNKAYGGGYPTVTESTSFSGASFVLSEAVAIGNHTGTSLIDALNAAADYYYLRGYSHWLLNKDNNEVSFTVKNRAKPIVLNSQLILLPGLASEGTLWLDGWYTDSSCTASLTDYEINIDTKLYGKWEENYNSYTITFDTRGGTPVPEPIIAQFGTIVSLPSNITRERYEFMWWENDYEDRVPFYFTVPSHNITLHAVWLCTRIKTAEDLIDFSKFVSSEFRHKLLRVHCVP